MSGINGPGPKIGGTYDNMRDKIREDSGGDKSKILRGEDDTGKVYLHHGSHNWFRGTERKEERDQGTINILSKLSEKLGGGQAGRNLALGILDDIGVRKDDGSIKRQFIVDDFRRVDRRVEQMVQQNPGLGHAIELSRLNHVSRNWDDYVKVPSGLTEEFKYSESKTEWVPPPPEEDPDQLRPAVRHDYTVEHTGTRVRNDVDQEMQTRVRARLQTESQNGQVALDDDDIRTFIGDEVQKFVKERTNNT